MKTTTKLLATVVATLALGSVGLVFAHQGGQDGGHGMGMQERARGEQGPHGVHGMSRHGDNAKDRLATLKTELAITTDQETAWQAYEAVVRQQASTRQAMREAMHASMQSPNAAASSDHSAQHASMQKFRESHQAEREAARQALMAVLTPEQKSLAEQRLGVRHGDRQGHRGHGEGHGHAG